MAARDEDDLASAAPLDHVPRHELAHVEPAGERPLDHLGERLGIESRKSARRWKAGLLTKMSMRPRRLDRPR